MKTLLLASRHINPSHQAAAEKTFGDNIRIVAEDIRWGGNPVDALRQKLSELAQAGHEVIAVAPTGRDEDLLRLLTAQPELNIRLVRAIFARDDFGRTIPFVGGDPRDLTVDHFADLQIRIEPVVRTAEDPPFSITGTRIDEQKAGDCCGWEGVIISLKLPAEYAGIHCPACGRL